MLDGDVERVKKALVEISRSLPSSSFTEHLSKKVRFDPSLSDQTTAPQATPTDSIDNTDVDMSSEGTSRKGSVTQDFAAEQDPASAIVGVSLAALYECTSHNCNILHICCWGKSSKEKMEIKETSKKTFHPFRGKLMSVTILKRYQASLVLCLAFHLSLPVDHLQYHSISARPGDNDRSFEESRYHHMTKGYSVVENGRGQDQTPSSSYLTILEMLLSWESIRPVVLKLVGCYYPDLVGKIEFEFFSNCRH